MGFDLGALLRGGGAGMAGYTEGQNERQKREEEARRAALSEALMNAQFGNYQSLAADRRVDNERLRAGDAAAQAAAEAAAAATSAEADHYRQMFPQLANLPDTVAVSQGKILQTQKDRLDRDRARPQTPRTPTEPRSPLTLKDVMTSLDEDLEWGDLPYDVRLREAKRRVQVAGQPYTPAPPFKIGGFGQNPNYPGGADYPARQGPATVTPTAPTPTTQPYSPDNPFARR